MWNIVPLFGIYAIVNKVSLELSSSFLHGSWASSQNYVYSLKTSSVFELFHRFWPLLPHFGFQGLGQNHGNSLGDNTVDSDGNLSPAGH